MTEFTANNNDSVSTNISSFFVNYEFHLWMSFDWLLNMTELWTTRERIQREKADFIAVKMNELWDFLKDETNMTQTKMKVFTNNWHSMTLRYKVSDMIWLFTKNIWTEQPLKKLNHKMKGSFRIVRKVYTSSYELELSASMKTHWVFHSLLLWLNLNDLLLNQTPEPVSSVIVNDKEEWEVDNILNSRLHYERLQYQVKWHEIDVNWTWYNAESFEHSPELIRAFHEVYLNKLSAAVQSFKQSEAHSRREER